MRVFIRDQPQRAVALATDEHVLILRHSPAALATRNGSTTSIGEGLAPKCAVEFSPWEAQNMRDFRALSSHSIQGTLGLVTINGDVFMCVVTSATRAASVRDNEAVQQIRSVEFHCLNRSDYDHLLNDQINPFPTDGLDADGHDHLGYKEPILEHPCMALKKLLSGGSFYYSSDFDLTKRLQDRQGSSSTVSIDSLDAGFLWNSYMIQPLVEFRSRLAEREKAALDQSGILTSAIRGFASTIRIPASSSPARSRASGLPSQMTVISRLSCRRAGTRFNARGMDDDGNVANFVETETIFATDTICFSYVQCRGSVPIFWEQASGLPGQQKIQITRSAEATQPAFDRHFEALAQAYGDVFVVNLLSEEKPNEVQLTKRYMHHIAQSPLNHSEEDHSSLSQDHCHLKYINYDFHAETRGPYGYEAASGIRRSIGESSIAFEYYLTEEIRERLDVQGEHKTVFGQNEVLKQAGVFRTNCLDCLDRTNLVQTIISQLALDIFIRQQGENPPTSDFWARHSTLWADCGDALSKIYAGTGALKSSFTRSGKMSFAGALADVRKSAQRLYINNFEDKGRQNTIDMLLGRLIGQMPVHLFDPINDWVMAELNKRSVEYSRAEQMTIYVGTFNLNGKTAGLQEDLSPWLCPNVETSRRTPEIVAIGFQEIVDLDVQQIMSTDPNRRHQWDEAVRRTLNANAKRHRSEEYVLLRGGQLVGASLSVFVRTDVLPRIKNVEGAVKKTGMSGMAGNKGAVAIRFDYADSSICLVTAHLAAGFANYEERNQDYRTIAHGLRFQRNRSIEDHRTIIWFGDFNYRIGISNERARSLISQRDLHTLYENDQLNLQMVHGKSFPHYSEKTPMFLPTYKYNIGTDEYDSSEKARIPAWCDRILTRGDNLQQLYYDAAPLRFSDHRPVWGLFNCKVNAIDQAAKDRISSELYAERRAVVGGHTASKNAESDDESLYGYDSIEPGLPPASSDRHKWWLDNGMPSRSTVQPPSKNSIVNPARPSNPFTPSSEPDWIEIEQSDAPPTAPSLASSMGSSTAEQSTFRSSEISKVRSSEPLRPLPGPRLATNGDAARVHLKQTLRKPPPKPSKPVMLRSPSNASTVSLASQKSTVPPPPPQPRRTATPSAVKAASSAGSHSTPPARVPTSTSPFSPQNRHGDNANPPLPPRRGTQSKALMDEENEKGQVRGWEPLKPQ